MTKSITFNSKRYNLEQIKKKIESIWNENFCDIEVDKQRVSVIFSNKGHTVDIPLSDLDNYV